MLLFVGATWIFIKVFFWHQQVSAERAAAEARQAAIERAIAAHDEANASSTEQTDLFGDDQLFRVLLIGLDNRIGQEEGHCDAIQLVTIDRENEKLEITAVPRGTYSPLPPGKGTPSSDYYVSNACGFSGLEYGIKQIEHILGVHPDAIVTVGFSQMLGVLNTLQLPSTETLQWLRHRKTYLVGEPQRARNHSTFLKHVMLNYLPKEDTATSRTLLYLLYHRVQTNLTLPQVQTLVNTVAAMPLTEEPERIQLSMRPAYAVSDIPYDPAHVGEEVSKRITLLEQMIGSDEYSELDEQEADAKVIEQIESELENSEFLTWAFTNQIWLQIHDEERAQALRFDLLTHYVEEREDKKEKEMILAEYILEMRHLEETEWEAKGVNFYLCFW